MEIENIAQLIPNIFVFKTGKAYLKTRESRTVEFKRSFNLGNLAEYAKDMSAFSNNIGGCLVFGVEDSPHLPIGINQDKFANVDEAKITAFLNEHFSPVIEWRKETFEFDNNIFGIFYVEKSRNKPIIAIRDGGKSQEIKNGEIYYRYIGRTEKIHYSEIKNIIDERIHRENTRWQDLFQKIAKIGPENAVIVDTIEGQIEEGQRTILIDNEIIEKIKFIKEGHFNETTGAATLKLIGEVKPADVVGVINTVVHDDPYIYRAKDVAEKVSQIIDLPFRTSPEHVKCWRYFNVRGSYEEGKIKCNPKYCEYKEKLQIFMFTQDWVDILIQELSNPVRYHEIMG